MKYKSVLSLGKQIHVTILDFIRQGNTTNLKSFLFRELLRQDLNP